MRQQLILLFCLFIGSSASSQIKGKVTNTNNEPLPFVNIYIENTFTGTTSNEDGNYELNVTETKSYTLIFQSLGFKTVKRTVAVETFPFNLNVTLEDEEITLNEVVINTADNPANAIIRQTIAKRKANLERIQSYKANFYSRGLIRIKEAPEKLLGQDIGDLGGGLDSTRSGIIYLSETISKIEFLRPNKLKETITASKVSGNDNGFSFNNAIDVDYNFYSNTIELGNQIISPIADYAFNYYRYTLDGIFYDDRGNLINKVKVIPKRQNDRIFSGYIYIVENQWTIYALELSITGEQAQIPAADNITIKQNFSYSEADAIWALMSQSIDFKYGIFGIKGDGRFTAVYSNYEFNAELRKNDFGPEIVSFIDEANKKDSSFWKSIRPVPLTDEEITDYIKKDSIQIVRKSKPYLDSIDAKNNRFKLGNIISGYSYSNSFENWNMGFSSPITAISFNTVQGWNINLDSYYRKNYDEFRRYFTLNGTINYGFSDERLRGTMSATYKFNNVSRPFLTVSGGVVAQQFNANDPISKTINTAYSLLAEKNYLKLYDKSFLQIAFSNELFNGFRLSSSLALERRKALFNTTDQVWYPKSNRNYTSNNPLDPTNFGSIPFETHTIAKLNINARINFGQTYLRYPGSKINIPNNDVPSLTIGYEKGFAATKSEYNYDQIKAQLSQDFNIGNKGNFQYNIKAGTFFNAEDMSFIDYQHFNGNQTHIGSGSYLNVFNNLPYYDLSTNTSYFEFHAEHDFSGYILGKLPLLNMLNFNLILGAHALAIPNTNPYQEYSIGIDNIGWGKFRFLRLDYVRSYQSGFQSDAILFGLKFF
ncbi:carboxypeptidase-like protein [Flavobacteriaceae bacterium MAR_2010_105]|nr:carboxypeptidase-like protein [Flavobacteriaceae bacterium MAR_2010_105]